MFYHLNPWSKKWGPLQSEVWQRGGDRHQDLLRRNLWAQGPRVRQHLLDDDHQLVGAQRHSRADRLESRRDEHRELCEGLGTGSLFQPRVQRREWDRRGTARSPNFSPAGNHGRAQSARTGASRTTCLRPLYQRKPRSPTRPGTVCARPRAFAIGSARASAATIQWQAFITLCGQIDANGVKHVSPELVRAFFNSEEPFFQRLADRRQRLRDGTLSPGDPSGILADAPQHIVLEATDLEYKKNKSGLWIILKIGFYMLFGRQSRLGPLPGT